MVVSRIAPLIIDVQEAFQHRPYWSNDDLPVLLKRLQDLVDGAKARDVPAVQSFHVTHPSLIYAIQNTVARVLRDKGAQK
jgi:hypothetical protein